MKRVKSAPRRLQFVVKKEEETQKPFAHMKELLRIFRGIAGWERTRQR